MTIDILPLLLIVTSSGDLTKGRLGPIQTRTALFTDIELIVGFNSKEMTGTKSTSQLILDEFEPVTDSEILGRVTIIKPVQNEKPDAFFSLDKAQEKFLQMLPVSVIIPQSRFDKGVVADAGLDQGYEMAYLVFVHDVS